MFTGSALTVAQDNVAITHGPLAGEVTDTSVVLWARAEAAGQIVFHVFDGPDAANEVVTAAVEVDESSDFTGELRIGELAPNTTYYYFAGELAPEVLSQFTTAPEQLEYWCERQPIPCFEPGTPIEEVFPNDPQQWVQMRGFFEPGSFKNGIREFRWTTFGFDAETLALKLMQEYLGDAISLEEAMAELQVIAEEEADKAIREHPEWDTDGW